MRKFALLLVTLVVTITSNAGIIYVPENASDAAKAGMMAAPVTTKVASKQKVAKGKLFMKVFKSKLEKIGKAGKRAGDKSKIAAALLAFFLGGFGVHDFYLGNKRNGIIKLLGSILGIALMVIGFVAAATTTTTTGLAALPALALIGWLIILGVSIWAFVDFIRILTGSYQPVDGSYTD